MVLVLEGKNEVGTRYSKICRVPTSRPLKASRVGLEWEEILEHPRNLRKEEKREEAGKEYEESCKRSSFLIIWAFEASLSDGGFVLQVEGCRKHNFK